MTTLNDQECDDFAHKIDSEGFDYYFTDYGPDQKLIDLFGKEIEDFVKARKTLQGVLLKAGIEIEY